MTETITLPDGQVAESPHTPRPASDGAALHAIEDATAHLKERAEKIRANPEAHLPKLILSQHVRGTSILDRIATRSTSSAARCTSSSASRSASWPGSS